MPLHSVLGEFVKALREVDGLESVMAEPILKSSILVLAAIQ